MVPILSHGMTNHSSASVTCPDNVQVPCPSGGTSCPATSCLTVDCSPETKLYLKLTIKADLKFIATPRSCHQSADTAALFLLPPARRHTSRGARQTCP